MTEYYEGQTVTIDVGTHKYTGTVMEITEKKIVVERNDGVVERYEFGRDEGIVRRISWDYGGDGKKSEVLGRGDLISN